MFKIVWREHIVLRIFTTPSLLYIVGGCCRARFTFPFKYSPVSSSLFSTNLQVHIVDGVYRSYLFNEFGHCVTLHLLRVEDVLGSTLTTVSPFPMFLTLALAPAPSRVFANTVFLSVFRTYILHLVLDLSRFISRFGLVHPATKDGSNWFLHKEASEGCESNLIKTFQFSSNSVISSCKTGEWTIFIYLVGNSGSIKNAWDRHPLRHWRLSSCGLPSCRR